MPTLTESPEQKTSAPLFIGLQSYTEEQAAIFFGRDDEIDRLTNLIKANTLTIVFGRSGTGKTSLLNAGVFPRLRKDYCLPFRIRLEFNEDSPSLVTQIRQVLKTEIDKYGFTVDAYPKEETLWEYFHREPLWRSVTPILIFDQFEEIFTLAKKSARFDTTERDVFWQELADLIENSIPESLKETFLDDKESMGFNYKVPKAKVLFAFREEFLPEFESITAKIPSLKYSRFRLLPMNGNQAYEVVTKTWKSNISAAQAHKIVEFFANGDDQRQAYEVMTIEPSLLSQVCALIDRERLKEGSSKISPEFLNRYSKEFILRSIYDEALAESNAAVGGAGVALLAAKPVNVFVEEHLITDEGYRTKYVLSENDSRLKAGIHVLKSKYFVRGEGRSIELTHDVLTPMIKKDREERRNALALALAKHKAKRRMIRIVSIALGVLLVFCFLVVYKTFQRRNELNDEIVKQEKSLKVLGVQLSSSQKKLDDINLKLNNTGKRKRNGGGVNNAADSLAQQQSDSTFSADSSRNAMLLAERQNLQRQRAELESKAGLQLSKLTEMEKRQKRADSLNRSTIRQLRQAQQKRITDSLQFSFYKENYDKIRAEYEAYRRTHPFAYPPEAEPEVSDAADTNSLKLDLRYSLPKNKPAKTAANLRIYLIPVTPENKAIIRKAKRYEIYCNEMNLDAAKGKQVARYINGNYTFFNVPPGNQEYFVKICDYYGGFYTLKKSKAGNEVIRLDAAPPIR
jgi:hypothetical protein